MKKLLSVVLAFTLLVTTLCFSFSVNAKPYEGGALELGEDYEFSYIESTSPYDVSFMTNNADIYRIYAYVMVGDSKLPFDVTVFKGSAAIIPNEDTEADYALDKESEYTLHIEKKSVIDLAYMSYSDEELDEINETFYNDEDLMAQYSYDVNEYIEALFYNEYKDDIDGYLSGDVHIRIGQMFISSSYTFELRNGELYIVSYNGTSDSITLPESYEDYSVAGIDDGAFSSSSPDVIEVPENYKTLNLDAFASMNSTKLVILGKDTVLNKTKESFSPQIYAYSGSAAEKYAKDNSVSFGTLADNYKDFSYRLEGIKAVVTAYLGSGDKVSIPSDFLGFTTDRVEVFAFLGRDLELTVPDNVEIVNSHTEFMNYNSETYSYAITKGMSFEEYVDAQVDFLVEIGFFDEEAAKNYKQNIMNDPETYLKDVFSSIGYEIPDGVSVVDAITAYLENPLGANSVINVKHGSRLYSYARNNNLKVSFIDKHTYKSYVTRKATCTRKGEIVYECVCGESYKEDIPLIKHTPIADSAKQATFTNTGLTAGSHCEYCGKTLVAQKTVAKLKKPSLSKLTKDKKSFKASWKKVSGISGYQLQYSTNKSFKKKKKGDVVKTVNVSAKSTSKAVKKLKAKKKYYVRIRAYKTISGKKVYCSWSKAKSVTTKK